MRYDAPVTTQYSGGLMDCGKLRGLLVAVAGSVMAMMAANLPAQAPGGGPQGGMGMMGPMDRAGMTQRMALDDAALKLSAEQKAKIDKILDAYIADRERQRPQMTPGSPPSEEARAAMRAAREKLRADIGAVLDGTQKTTWEAALAARRPARGPGRPQ